MSPQTINFLPLLKNQTMLAQYNKCSWTGLWLIAVFIKWNDSMTNVILPLLNKESTFWPWKKVPGEYYHIIFKKEIKLPVLGMPLLH